MTMEPMRRRSRPRLAAAVAAAAVLVSGCAGAAAGQPALTWVAPADRTAVGSLPGTLIDGSAYDVNDHRGHVVVVNFWGSWCGPCVAEAPALEQVYRDYHARGLDMVGIDIRDNKASATAFIRDHALTYPMVFDPANTLALRLHGIAPNVTPTTVVIDRQGRVAARQSGAILYTTLRDVVQRALREPA